MKVNDLDISIKDYLGVLEGGISVVLSIKHDDSSYEGIYWYDSEHKVLTIESFLEEKIGEIEKYQGYDEIMKELDKETPDFNELYDQLPPI